MARLTEGGNDVRQNRIVVADDDPIVIKFLAAVFQDEGFEVLVAEDGEIEVSTGAGVGTTAVKVRDPERPPPGAGLKTVT